MSVKIFKNKPFSRFARQERIADRDLCEAIERAERGLVDADLGGGLIKQGIPRPNEGRSGGFRSLVAYRVEDRAFFLYGYPKNSRDNVRADEVKSFRELGKFYLGLSDELVLEAVEDESLIEVICNGEKVQE